MKETPRPERLPDPAGNLLEAVWNEEWQRNLVDTALEKLKTQAKPKHYQIFYLLAVKEQPLTQVAKALGVIIGQVYLVKQRVGGLFKKAWKDAEAKAG